jgi:hypothetical protein
MSGIDGSDDVDADAAALHDAVAKALGLDAELDPDELVEERPPLDVVDIDDGTNESIRLRILLGNTRDY